MTDCIRIYLGNFVIVGADGGCSLSLALSLALRVDFVQLCTYRMHIERSFLASRGFWMFAITHTISAFQGLAGLSKKRRWLQVMGRGGAIWG